ncbi:MULTISPECIES: low temperature requirement protein A [unclassified Micromonospora]|uniref:low temperature requirement protein A n=1 Tax=unclassified Micromonospora TaxID=2617518 RepID=UPI001C23E1D8|nr:MULTISPECIES: low temperature requirement protein A [unclassified Micromonospora]MBU8861801.1 low temperature requirement protein A [Micromonospora sp. WMMB482]MDM4781382.1 low temperature requirement protein A [Micromonospora sp. b486]
MWWDGKRWRAAHRPGHPHGTPGLGCAQPSSGFQERRDPLSGTGQTADGTARQRQTYAVDPVELFFDLVFVFAIFQLTTRLREDPSIRGAGETGVLLLAVFTVWYFTSWEATLVRTERTRTTAMVLTVTFFGLFLTAAVSRAFTGSGWDFAAPFLLVQLGRGLWTLLNVPGDIWRDHYRRTLLWLLVSAPLWAIGAVAAPAHRLYWWAAAAGVDLLGTWLGHPIPGRTLHSENAATAESAHMLERCRLFLLLALGGTVLSTGLALTATPLTPLTVVTGSAALLVTVALWLLAFGGPGRLVQHHVERTGDPNRATRMAGNVLTVMVAGLIAVAAAQEMIIRHPHGRAAATISVLLYGGSILFLLAQGWYLRRVPPSNPRPWLIAATALALAGAITGALAPPYLTLLTAAALLIIAATKLTHSSQLPH